MTPGCYKRHNALALQLWRVTHPHVYSIPVLFNDPPTNCPALVMPFFPNGNIIKYLLAFPEEAFDLNSTRRLLVTCPAFILNAKGFSDVISDHGNVGCSVIPPRTWYHTRKRPRRRSSVYVESTALKRLLIFSPISSSR